MNFQDILGIGSIILVPCFFIVLAWMCITQKHLRKEPSVYSYIPKPPVYLPDGTMILDNPQVLEDYYITWVDAQGRSAYSQWVATDPDDAVSSFTVSHPGRKILVVTTNVDIAAKRISSRA